MKAVAVRSWVMSAPYICELKTLEEGVVQDEISLSDVGDLYLVTRACQSIMGVGEASVCLR